MVAEHAVAAATRGDHQDEVARGERFGFGDNWAAFLQHLDEDRIREAEASIVAMLRLPSLQGKTVLDVGSGSGLFSLAARRLGARVRSFDFDPQSVACTAQLKRRFFPNDEDWTVSEGSVLDEEFVRSLGKHDLVYAWGVLHHTGQMYQALRIVKDAVAPGGGLFIALYNDEGWRSKMWWRIKRLYCRDALGRMLVTSIGVPYFAFRTVVSSLVRGRNPISEMRNYKAQRGMSIYHDWIDWLGGFPFEVATPGDILDFFRQFGFELERLRTTGSGGCNEFVFRSPSAQNSLEFSAR